ncbi:MULTISPECIES: hypothetical protein [Streptomyces]|uniref:hypothetical protein n=1 Tax=Streptomyces TaxID=1883 RepID=UPI000A9332A9|nr:MULTISPECIES: hypothetical protein [Streptomyces]
MTRLRPDLSDAQTCVLTYAVFSMINAVAQFNSGLDPDIVARTIRTAAINALLIPADTI